MTAWIVMAVLMPLVAPLLTRRSEVTRVLLPLAALPALVLAVGASGDDALELSYLLYGSRWTVDGMRRVFLLLTAVLWAASGIHAVGYLGRNHLWRFGLFWSLTMAGNVGLILAADVAGFYSFFALMTLAGYGLVTHAGTSEARRAGRVYLIMALLGEVSILAGLLMATAAAGSMMLAELPAAIAVAGDRVLISTFLLLGFGVKAGLPLLHFWLPLAHPQAPTPASAVLSGAMIKAGLFGWLVTLPLGEAALPILGSGMAVMGATAALGGAVIGILQRPIKAILAYSSISQMGLMTVMVGMAVAVPERAPTLIAAVGLYALHHGLAKGALFLSTALAWPTLPPARTAMWALVSLPGLSLAGLPLTSGAAGKQAMKAGLSAQALPMGSWLPVIMTAGTVGTTLVVLRFLGGMATRTEIGRSSSWVVLGWGLSTAASLLLFWWMPWPSGAMAGVDRLTLLLPDVYVVWKLLWPPLIGAAIAVAVARGGLTMPTLPPGDGIVWMERFVVFAAQATRRARTRVAKAPRVDRGWNRLRTWLRHRMPSAEVYESAVRREADLLFILILVIVTVLVFAARLS